MGFCQWFVIVIYLLDLGINLAKHGERKKESRYNFWSALVAIVIMMLIFKYGGFFG